MPIYLVRHVTTYRYSGAVAFGEHRMMLRPRAGHDQHTRETRVDISPEPETVTWSEDPLGNLVGHARFASRGSELRVEAQIEVEVVPLDPAAAAVGGHAAACPFVYGAEELPDLGRFLERRHPDPDEAVEIWARSVLEEDPARGSLAFLRRLSARIRRDFSYRRRLQKGVQEPVRTLRLGTGSCRDFAVLMAEAVRSLGFAARFASGYLHVPVDDPEIASIGGHTHAWVQVFLPGIGWVDFDPASGTAGNRDLIRVALVRDHDQATPLSGTYFGPASAFEEMSVGVTVTQLDRPPGFAASRDVREFAAA